MRHIGSLTDQAQATKFEAFLTLNSINATVEQEGDEWAVWVHNEDQLQLARDEFAEFRAAPDGEKYANALTGIEKQRKQADKEAKKRAKRVVNVRDRWQRPASQQSPATLALIAICLISAFVTTDWQALGQNNSVRLGNKESPVLKWLWINSFENDDGNPTWGRAMGLHQIKSGQVWRLVTPIFIHLGILHIIFNMMWTQRLGLAIEFRLGSLRFLALVIVIAVFSNLVQYFWSGPAFGGISGVVCGLFGYIWLKSKYDRRSDFFMDSNLALYFMIYLLICAGGVLGPVANGAHFGGLFAGALIAMVPVWWRQVNR